MVSLIGYSVFTLSAPPVQWCRVVSPYSPPDLPYSPETPDLLDSPETPDLPYPPETPDLPDSPETPDLPHSLESRESPEHWCGVTATTKSVHNQWSPYQTLHYRLRCSMGF